MAMEQRTIELVERWLAPILLDAALKGVAILALTSLAILLMRKASAAGRHLVWFLGAASLLLLPVLSAILPAWQILPTWASATTPSTLEASAVSETTPAASPLLVGVEQSDPLPLGEELERGSTASNPIQASAPAAAPEPHHATSAAHSSQGRSGGIGSVAPSLLLLTWLIGAALLFARLTLALLSLQRLQRCSSPLTTGQVPALAEQLRNQLNVRRTVHLLTSPQRTVPMTWGLLRARLLVPADCQWTPDQLRAVLLHELAHTKRWDCLTQSLVQLACALYWFNPLIWLAWHRIQIERERACDDLVLATGTRPSTYAQQLLHIASEMPAVRLSAAAIAMARPGSLEGRLRAILDATRNRRALTGIAIAICILALLATIIPLASLSSVGPAILPGQPVGDALDIRLLGVIPDGGDDVMGADGQKLGDELAAFALSPYSSSYWGPMQRQRTFILELPSLSEPITFTFAGLSVAGESYGLSSGQHPLMLEHKGRHYLSLLTTFPRTRRTQLAGMIDRDVPFDAIDLTLRYFVGPPGKAIFSVKGPLKLGVPVSADAATQTTVTLTQDRRVYSEFHLSSRKYFDAAVIAYDKQGHRHLITRRSGRIDSSGTEMGYDLGDLSPSDITLLTFGETPRERIFQNIRVSYANRPPTDYAPYLDQMAGRLGIAGLSGEQRASYDLSARPRESLAVVDVVRGLHLYHAVNALHGMDFSKLSAEDQARVRGAANRLVQSPFAQVRGLALQLGLRGSWPEFVDPAIEFVRGSDPERGGVAQALGNYTPQLSADQLGRIRDILLGAEDRMTLWSLWRCFALRRDEPPAVEAMVAFAQSPKTWLWWMAIPELGKSKAGRDHITQLAGRSTELRRRVLLRADTIPGTTDADLNDARTLLPDLLRPSLQRVDLSVFSEVLRLTVEHRDQRANTEVFVQYLGQLLSEWDLSRIPGMADDNWWAVDRMVKYINLWHGVNIGSLGTDVSQETRAIHEIDWKAIAADAIRWHTARVAGTQERRTTDFTDNAIPIQPHPAVIVAPGSYASPSRTARAIVAEDPDGAINYELVFESSRAPGAKTLATRGAISTDRGWCMAWDVADRFWIYQPKHQAVTALRVSRGQIDFTEVSDKGGWEGVPDAFVARLPRALRTQHASFVAVQPPVDRLVGPVLTSSPRYLEGEKIAIRLAFGTSLNWELQEGFDGDAPDGNRHWRHWFWRINGNENASFDPVLFPNRGSAMTYDSEELHSSFPPGRYRVEYVGRDLPIVRSDGKRLIAKEIASNQIEFEVVAAAAAQPATQTQPTTDSADNTDRTKPSSEKSAQPVVETLRPAASGSAAEAANSQWRVKLPSGVTVELLGVTEHSRQEKPWWRPDGSPLAQAPDHTPKRSEVPEIVPPAYYFPILVTGIPCGEAEPIARITPEETAGGNGLTQVTWKGIVPPPSGYRGPLPATEDTVYTPIKSFPATVDRAAIEFGVPGGEWKTIARNARNDDKWPDYLTHRGADGPNVDVSFGQPYMAKFGQWNLSTVRVSVSHNIPADRQARVVAVLADGTELAGQANTTDGHIQQIPETFSRYRGLGEPRQQDMLRTEDIKEFRLQTRAFQWVRFENIALRPRPASATQPAAPRQ